MPVRWRFVPAVLSEVVTSFPPPPQEVVEIFFSSPFLILPLRSTQASGLPCLMAGRAPFFSVSPPRQFFGFFLTESAFAGRKSSLPGQSGSSPSPPQEFGLCLPRSNVPLTRSPSCCLSGIPLLLKVIPRPFVLSLTYLRFLGQVQSFFFGRCPSLQRGSLDRRRLFHTSVPFSFFGLSHGSLLIQTVPPSSHRGKLLWYGGRCPLSRFSPSF